MVSNLDIELLVLVLSTVDVTPPAFVSGLLFAEEHDHAVNHFDDRINLVFLPVMAKEINPGLQGREGRPGHFPNVVVQAGAGRTFLKGKQT